MRPIFNQCCCCFSLETGGQIIGWLYTICGILAAIGCTGFAVIFSQADIQDDVGDIKTGNLMSIQCIKVEISSLI